MTDAGKALFVRLGAGGGGATEVEAGGGCELLCARRVFGFGAGLGGAGLRSVCFMRWVGASEVRRDPARAGWLRSGVLGLTRRSRDCGLSVGGLVSKVRVRVGRAGGLGFGHGASTSTQSESALPGVNGLPDLGVVDCDPLGGILTAERAGMPLSSHHLRLSELAGGSPGSTDS